MIRDLSSRLGVRLVCLVLVLVVVGCSDNEASPGGDSDAAMRIDGHADGQTDATNGDGLTWHSGIGQLLADNCGGCHQEDGSGPFVVDYDSTVAWSSAINAAVTERRMPPMPVNNDGSCNTFANSRWLSDAEIAQIGAWIDAGTPLGEGDQSYAFPQAQDLADVTVTLTTPSYTPNGERNDDYRCYVLDPGQAEDMYITAYQVVPGNPPINHHMILYDISDPQWAIDKDAESEEPGYQCFGSAGPGSSPLALWAPGSGYNQYPSGTGIKLTANKKVIAQMHYNVKAGVMTDPGTQVKLALTKSVDRAAQYLPMAHLGMRLEPQNEYVTTRDTLSLPSPGLRVYGIMPHMHNLGRTLRVDIESGGESQCMVDVDRWDFNWQESWWYDTPIEFSPARTLDITIECGYNTMGRNDIVTWGDGTDDEMCLNFFYVTSL